MTKRSLNWRALAMVVGAIALIWIAAEIILAGQNEVIPPPSSQAITLKGGRVTATRISTKSWSFEYRHAQMSPDGMNAAIDGLRRGVFYKDGRPYLSIAAEHVSVNTQTFDFTATGEVHIEQLHAKDGLRRSFDTDLAQWANAPKMLRLRHPSIVRTGGETLRVASITVDFNGSQVHFGRIGGGVAAP